MNSPETLRFEFYQTGCDRNQRYCGLINPEDMPQFEVVMPEQEELDTFDNLVEMANEGWVCFRGNLVRIDHHMENGNEVRSILEYTPTDEGGSDVLVTNLIRHVSGSWYLSDHVAHVDKYGQVWEPNVGSSGVKPGCHGDYVKHYQVAYEADTKLPAAA